MIAGILLAGALLFDTTQVKEEAIAMPISDAYNYFNPKCVPDSNVFNHLKLMVLLSTLKLTCDSLNTSIDVNPDLIFTYKNKKLTMDQLIEKILKTKGSFRQCYIQNSIGMIQSFYDYEVLTLQTIDEVAAYCKISNLKEYSDFKLNLK